MINLTYWFTTFTVAFALFQRRNLNLLYICVSLCALLALQAHIISPIGMAILALFALVVYAFYHFKTVGKIAHVGLWLIMCFLLYGLVLHEFAGFAKILEFDHAYVSALSKPYSKYLNFDKTMAGLILFVLSPLIILERRIDVTAAKQTAMVLLLNIILILTPAVISGYVKFDAKIPSILIPWAISNFLFVCFAEEVIFRGFVQKTLQQWFSFCKNDYYMPIILASIIFGLAHYKDGLIFMILAAICGLFYGYVYQRTNRVLCAILVHFGLNLSHILFFTYPAMQAS